MHIQRPGGDFVLFAAQSALRRPDALRTVTELHPIVMGLFAGCMASQPDSGHYAAMVLHRAAALLMVPAAVMVVMAQDVAWPFVLEAGPPWRQVGSAAAGASMAGPPAGPGGAAAVPGAGDLQPLRHVRLGLAAAGGRLVARAGGVCRGEAVGRRDGPLDLHRLRAGPASYPPLRHAARHGRRLAHGRCSPGYGRRRAVLAGLPSCCVASARGGRHGPTHPSGDLRPGWDEPCWRVNWPSLGFAGCNEWVRQ